jgi:hypothetical protein
LNSVTHLGSSGTYHVLETKFPVCVSHHSARSAIRPTVRIAARSLCEIPITREAGWAIFSSSPTVLTRRRCGELPVASRPPTSRVPGSSTLVTFLFSTRSYQSLPTMPLIEGGAPVSIAMCPTAVTEG